MRSHKRGFPNVGNTYYLNTLLQLIVECIKANIHNKMIKIIEEFNKLKQTPIQGIEVNIGQEFFHWNGLFSALQELLLKVENFASS
ncbi:unnamed protein product [Blepharisma stoltei]|uniref:Uncharacterized protein n=1 Tax=Blepharisma stoltei TaxID=1481888 RepID=A0AAU9JEB4_9CILI|nr:unnamed protein product [Blepharisma stoltei]